MCIDNKREKEEEERDGLNSLYTNLTTEVVGGQVIAAPIQKVSCFLLPPLCCYLRTCVITASPPTHTCTYMLSVLHEVL